MTLHAWKKGQIMWMDNNKTLNRMSQKFSYGYEFG